MAAVEENQVMSGEVRRKARTGHHDGRGDGAMEMDHLGWGLMKTLRLKRIPYWKVA